MEVRKLTNVLEKIGLRKDEETKERKKRNYAEVLILILIGLTSFAGVTDITYIVAPISFSVIYLLLQVKKLVTHKIEMDRERLNNG